MYLPPGGLGVRVDGSCYPTYTVSPFYDSMIAKLIVHGKNKTEVIEKMKRVLSEFVVEGIETTIPFHMELMKHPEFIARNLIRNF